MQGKNFFMKIETFQFFFKYVMTTSDESFSSKFKVSFLSPVTKMTIEQCFFITKSRSIRVRPSVGKVENLWEKSKICGKSRKSLGKVGKNFGVYL